MDDEAKTELTEAEIESIRRMREVRRAISVAVVLLVLLAAILLALLAGPRVATNRSGMLQFTTREQPPTAGLLLPLTISDKALNIRKEGFWQAANSQEYART